MGGTPSRRVENEISLLLAPGSQNQKIPQSPF